MQIVRMEPETKKRKKIYLDDGTVFMLYAAEIRQLSLEADKELEEAVYVRIMEEILPKRAKLRAMHLLTKTDYTEHQIRSKLSQAFYPKKIVQDTIDFLLEHNYLNDERYIRSYVEYRCHSKSRLQLMHELRGKGITSELAGEIYDEICGDAEIEAIQKMMLKRRVDLDSAAPEELNKLFMYLMRKGFSRDKINEAMKKTRVE